MSLLAAVKLLDREGIRSATLTIEGDWRDGDLTVTPAHRMYPGTRSLIVARMWHAIEEHRHHWRETTAALDGSWTLLFVKSGPDTGAWQVRHDGCAVNRFTTGSAA